MSYLSPAAVTARGVINDEPATERLCIEAVAAMGGITTDARRMPNVNYANHGSMSNMLAHASVVDEDLVVTMLGLEAALVDREGYDHAALATLANALDAAIDEQDRRAGRPYRPRTPWVAPPSATPGACGTLVASP